MLTLAICDDEIYFSNRLRDRVGQYLAKRHIDAQITTFSSGDDLLNAETEFEIVLIDMKMPGKSGMEVVKQMRRENKNSQVVFITSYPEYALQAFDVDAIHYLLKPVSDEKLFHVLDKALKRAAESDSLALAISKGNSTQRIYVRDILYCEAIDHKIHIHTISAQYDYFGTLDLLQAKLDGRFFRCHRSYIVNLNFVINKDHDTATVSGGDQILVSRRKQQEFTQRLLVFFRKEVL